MNILMFTNTFSPHVGGVARSVSELADQLRKMGEQVLVIAPEFGGMIMQEEHVVRIPAIQNFAGTDFSVPLPLSKNLSIAIDEFQPDIVHSHHPFLLGDSALRAASSFETPIIFTHHTRYEMYGHYVAQDSDLLKRLALSLSLGYCDLCDGVIAPSLSIEQFLLEQGVQTQISTIPTGVDIVVFSNGDGNAARLKYSIPMSAPLIGHVGRLAPEKNLEFLARSLSILLQKNTSARALIVGDGPSRSDMVDVFKSMGVDDRVLFVGVLKGEELVDTYTAMDVFAFSSFSETQGMVLTEAMAAGVPVVALDAPGARELVRTNENGSLLDAEVSEQTFAEALAHLLDQDQVSKSRMQNEARRTASNYSLPSTAQQVHAFYRTTLATYVKTQFDHDSLWDWSKRAISKELDIVGNLAHAAKEAIFHRQAKTDEKP